MFYIAYVAVQLPVDIFCWHDPPYVRFGDLHSQTRPIPYKHVASFRGWLATRLVVSPRRKVPP